jgi:hypothetical protein
MSAKSELSEKIGVNLTPEQKREIRVEAAEHGMTIAEYVRTQLFEE